MGRASSPRYQLITGERRWRAARLAGLDHVDVIVKEVTPQEMLELALVENIQRADLNPLEEANAYQQLVDEFGLTQDRIAERVGRSRVSVANTCGCCACPMRSRSALLEREISEGHARALLMLDEAEEQLLALRAVLKKGLSVRQTEELVRRLQAATQATRQRTRSPETEALERQFRDSLGTKVDLFRSRKGGRAGDPFLLGRGLAGAVRAPGRRLADYLSRIKSGEPGSPLLLCPRSGGTGILVHMQDAAIIKCCRMPKGCFLEAPLQHMGAVPAFG